MPKKSDFLPLKEFFYFPKEISLYRSKQKQISKRKLFLIITTKKANNFAKKNMYLSEKSYFFILAQERQSASFQMCFEYSSAVFMLAR